LFGISQKCFADRSILPCARPARVSGFVARR